MTSERSTNFAAGPDKGLRVRLFTRPAMLAVRWTCVGDPAEVARLLSYAPGIGYRVAHGVAIPAMSVKDDLDYPGEREALAALTSRTGHALTILTPPVSLLAYLQTTRPSLVEDLHGRTADLSARWFYGLLDAYRAEQGYGGVLLGLRAQESRGRALNRATHGAVYQRADGLHVAQPLADWRALDVHAYLWRAEVPVLPVYLCVDPGTDPMALRKSWWVCGGGPARMGGHYAWLRRWWPACWRVAVEIDPEVARLS